MVYNSEGVTDQHEVSSKYAEESLIGVLKMIYHQPAHGPYKRIVQKVVLYNYFLYMVLLFDL